MSLPDNKASKDLLTADPNMVIDAACDEASEIDHGSRRGYNPAMENPENKNPEQPADQDRHSAEQLKIGTELHRIAQEVGGMDDFDALRQRSKIHGADLE